MNLEEAVLERLRHLPVDKQQQLLDFAEFLSQKATTKKPLGTIKGLCADLKVDITEEDIAQARQEMWANFPKDIVS
ncbi:hypothetical protein [Nodularia chucula]|uniref:hypothetical protein n=1 Tax=Nodularia chucula TaxID=3093667 RepID=UPI0039C61969